MQYSSSTKQFINRITIPPKKNAAAANFFINFLFLFFYCLIGSLWLLRDHINDDINIIFISYIMLMPLTACMAAWYGDSCLFFLFTPISLTFFFHLLITSGRVQANVNALSRVFAVLSLFLGRYVGCCKWQQPCMNENELISSSSHQHY